MTDKSIKISFLPQDVSLIKGFLYEENYINEFDDDKSLNDMYINMPIIEKKGVFCSNIVDLIINLIKKRDLKKYIWEAYTNINEKDKKNVYKEALGLFDKKQEFIENMIYEKVGDLVEENGNLNLDGFFKFRMKDSEEYISMISDMALEEYLIKRDKKEFLDSLKYFIDLQNDKMNLLRIVIVKEDSFILSDENGKELDNLKNQEMINIAIEENLSDEDLLISAIMTLCPKKIEIIDKINNKKTKTITDVINLLFEGKVTVIYSN